MSYTDDRMKEIESETINSLMAERARLREALITIARLVHVKSHPTKADISGATRSQILVCINKALEATNGRAK